MEEPVISESISKLGLAVDTLELNVFCFRALSLIFVLSKLGLVADILELNAIGFKALSLIFIFCHKIKKFST